MIVAARELCCRLQGWELVFLKGSSARRVSMRDAEDTSLATASIPSESKASSFASVAADSALCSGNRQISGVKGSDLSQIGRKKRPSIDGASLSRKQARRESLLDAIPRS